MSEPIEGIEKKLERRARRREKKKNPTMKVSGRSVRELQRLIIRKSRRQD
ncbi:MAG: hypothetical protein WC497_05055 [Patescibacteria group bacterium]